MLNIHKDTPQNPSEFDMEIASAQIKFRNFHSATYEPGRTWEIGEDGKSYPVGPRIVYSGQDAMDRIQEELKQKVWVYHLAKEGECGYSLGGCGVEPYFTIEFDFDSVVVCWDEYKKKAWYELHRQYRYEAVLHTLECDVTAALTVNSHEKVDQTKMITVICTFDGNDYRGRGKDHLWIDAFADLQRQLPEDVFLKCCLTCRHGNLCPVENKVNEVFCTKDVFVTQKSDLYFYTEDDSERDKRSWQYCGFCEDHQPQTDGFYTYNDYLFFLKKV